MPPAYSPDNRPRQNDRFFGHYEIIARVGEGSWFVSALTRCKPADTVCHRQANYDHVHNQPL